VTIFIDPECLVENDQSRLAEGKAPPLMRQPPPHQPPPVNPLLTFAEAFLNLQADIPRIPKGTQGQVGTRTYMYENLADMWDAVQPILHRHGFIWITKPDMRYPDGHPPLFVLAYNLHHVPSGESETGDYPLPNSTPQTMGGAITYAKRYALKAVLQIQTKEDDDDAAAAEHEATTADKATKGADWTPPADPKSRRAARQRDTAGEENEFQTPGPDDEHAKTQPGTINETQRRRLQILYRQTGRHSHDDHMAAIAKYLPGVTVTSTNELSFRDAETLARKLASEKAAPDA
jgi:hypothetical protein